MKELLVLMNVCVYIYIYIYIYMNVCMFVSINKGWQLLIHEGITGSHERLCHEAEVTSSNLPPLLM